MTLKQIVDALNAEIVKLVDAITVKINSLKDYVDSLHNSLFDTQGVIEENKLPEVYFNDADFEGSGTDADPYYIRKRIVSIAFTGNNTKTLTLTFADGTTMSASFQDLQGEGGGAVTLTSLNISGPASINEGSNGVYTVEGTYSDNSVEDITGSVIWSVTEGTFSGNTLSIPTNTVEGDDRVATITATYESVSNTFDVLINDTTIPPVGGGETLIFRDTFRSISGSSTPPANIGWNTINGNTATVNTTSFSGNEGPEANLPSLNAGYDVDTVNGICNRSTSTNQLFFFTEKYTISRASQNISRFKFWQWMGSTTVDSTAAVRVNAQWYVYNQFFRVSNIASNTDLHLAEQVDVIIQSGNMWLPLTLTIGTTMSLGTTPVSLPAGDITGMGIYTWSSNTQNVARRFNNLEFYVS
jgi:hypothetical protein